MKTRSINKELILQYSLDPAFVCVCAVSIRNSLSDVYIPFNILAFPFSLNLIPIWWCEMQQNGAALQKSADYQLFVLEILPWLCRADDNWWRNTVIFIFWNAERTNEETNEQDNEWMDGLDVEYGCNGCGIVHCTILSWTLCDCCSTYADIFCWIVNCSARLNSYQRSSGFSCKCNDRQER